MITSPDWLNPKEKQSFHQFSLDCIKEIAARVSTSINIEDIDYDTCLILLKILIIEIEDEEFFEFAIENLDELLFYITAGNLNIRMQRDITGEVYLACGYPWHF